MMQAQGPKSVAGFLVCWVLKVMSPQGVPSKNADWKVRNTLCIPLQTVLLPALVPSGK
jgi:hypothetical protein